MFSASLTRRAYSQLNKSSRLFSSTSISVQQQFAIVIRDFKDPECLQRRLNIREQHLKGAFESNSKGIINLGGAIFDDHQNKRMEGSFLLVSAESKKDIEKLIMDDPYYKGKVWEKWEILPVNLAVGKITPPQ